MDNTFSRDSETDPRFPSGRWTGFFLQPPIPGRHLMELRLTFRQGELTGEGRDWVGTFTVRGRYSLADGKCHWTKRYLGKHDVFYKGYNEGKGIWGLWEISATEEFPRLNGGFHIWPEGMADPTHPRLSEEADLPVVVTEELETAIKAASSLTQRRRAKRPRIERKSPNSYSGLSWRFLLASLRLWVRSSSLTSRGRSSRLPAARMCSESCAGYCG